MFLPLGGSQGYALWRAEMLKVLVLQHPFSSLGGKLMFLPLLPPRSLSISGPASWVERTLMFQILNYSWNICLASRVCCSLLRNLHLAPETSRSIGLCHLSEEGQFLQFRDGALQAISDCISVRFLFLSPFRPPARAHLPCLRSGGEGCFPKTSSLRGWTLHDSVTRKGLITHAVCTWLYQKVPSSSVNPEDILKIQSQSSEGQHET